MPLKSSAFRPKSPFRRPACCVEANSTRIECIRGFNNGHEPRCIDGRHQKHVNHNMTQPWACGIDGT